MRALGKEIDALSKPGLDMAEMADLEAETLRKFAQQKAKKGAGVIAMEELEDADDDSGGVGRGDRPDANPAQFARCEGRRCNGAQDLVREDGRAGQEGRREEDSGPESRDEEEDGLVKPEDDSLSRGTFLCGEIGGPRVDSPP